MSYWISDDSKATFYAAIAVIENIGHAIGDPSLQQIFAATLRLELNPFWQALPFFVAAVSRSIGLVCVNTNGHLGSLWFGRFVNYVYMYREGQNYCHRCWK